MKSIIGAVAIGLMLAGPARADDKMNFGEMTCKLSNIFLDDPNHPSVIPNAIETWIEGWLVGRKLDKAFKPEELRRWLRYEYCPTHPDETFKAAMDLQVTMLLIQLMPKH